MRTNGVVVIVSTKVVYTNESNRQGIYPIPPMDSQSIVFSLCYPYHHHLTNRDDYY
jgi:hypothetical protein